MQQVEKIGLIGVGLMGKGIGYNILKNNKKLYLLKGHSKENISFLEDNGAIVVDNIKEFCESVSIIVLCLPSAKEVLEVCEGTNGIIAYLKSGTKIYDCTTSYPQTTQKLSVEFAEKGIVFIDTPLTRTPTEAMEGRLNCIVGTSENEDDLFFLKMFCENVFFVGEIGNANKIKLLNNGLTLCNTALVAEIIKATINANVDIKKLREVVSSGGANSGQFQGMMSWILDGNENALKFSLKNALKDVDYLDDFLKESGCNVELLKTIQNIYQNKIKEYGENVSLPYLSGFECGKFSDGEVNE